ncbi:MAG TPA: ATP-grasp domain-containing protein [Acidimicrobiales bacterium]|nr:ATP-grasp domain-containing protein [Acidimicrobiales bacterium]
MTTGHPAGYEDCNDYTRIIVDEALGRGIDVVIGDPVLGELELRHGDVVHHAFQSLSDLTSAIAFRRCDDKLLTRRVLEAAGLPVAPGRLAGGDDADAEFLVAHGTVVVKPCRGEGGAGITVGVTDAAGLRDAIASARQHCSQVLLEAVAEGDDLRVLVIDDQVVAASVRRPPVVRGDASRSIRQLVEDRNQERTADGGFATPLDDITTATVRAAGHDLDDVLADGEELAVRRTANLHTGGTIHDVTDRLHPSLGVLARAATAAIGLPVAGVDLMVVDPSSEGPVVVIEVNEQPGLANHEPQPTAQRYLDLLFPATA